MEKQSGPAGPWRSALRHSHLGIQFGLTILIFVLAGYWADGKLGSQPWLVLVGLGVGFGAAFYNLYREVYGEKKGE